MPTPPPKVTPAILIGGNPLVLTSIPQDVVPQAFRYFTGALSYWLPHGLNNALANARMARHLK